VPKSRFAAALLATPASGVASAGVYTDQLSKCLVDGTTTEDRTMLVMFSNPQVAAVMTDLDKHLDPAKLKDLTDEEASS
jgi:hypothetical protein